MVVDFATVDAVAIPTRAGMDAQASSLVRAEAVKDHVVQIDKRLKQLRARPWVPGVVLRRQPTLGEVDANALCARGEAAANILFAFVDEVLDELASRVVGYLICASSG